GLRRSLADDGNLAFTPPAAQLAQSVPTRPRTGIPYLPTPISTPLIPAPFPRLGTPMIALVRNRYTEAWRTFGASVPRPRGILAVSAHWYVLMLAVTAMPRPRTIHDFFGFPKALFDVEYPAPGLPELVEEVAELAQPDRVGPDI